MGKKKDAINNKIRIYDRAADQALAAGNQKAFESFNESLHQARMEGLRIRESE